jgi:hypothetical protein
MRAAVPLVRSVSSCPAASSPVVLLLCLSVCAGRGRATTPGPPRARLSVWRPCSCARLPPAEKVCRIRSNAGTTARGVWPLRASYVCQWVGSAGVHLAAVRCVSHGPLAVRCNVGARENRRANAYSTPVRGQRRLCAHLNAPTSRITARNLARRASTVSSHLLAAVRPHLLFSLPPLFPSLYP